MIEFKNNIDVSAALDVLKRAIPKASKAMADVIHKEADRTVPEDTGALRRSGKVMPKPTPNEPNVSAHAVQYGSKKAPYAAAVHDGIVKTKSGESQWLRKAAMQRRPIMAAAQRVLKDALRKGGTMKDGTGEARKAQGVGVRFAVMRPLPWQGRFLRGLARPGVRTAALTVARSNGKSWLAAKLARDYLLGDRRDSEALIVASSYTQAKVIFRYALRMVEDAGHDPTDRGEWWYRDSVTTALLRSRKTGLAIRAIGSDPRRAHGRVYGLGLIDEPAQHPPGSRDAMLSAIRTGAGKVLGTKIVALGTRPAGAHWFADWLAGGADYVQSHAARRNDPPYWLRTIRRANPSYDYLPALREDLATQRREAKGGDEAARARYLALALNMGTADTVENVLLPPEAWERIEADVLPDRAGPYVLGFDLGGSGAFTAAAGVLARVREAGSRGDVRRDSRSPGAGRSRPCRRAVCEHGPAR